MMRSTGALNFTKGGSNMYKQVVRLGVASVKRSFLSMEEAVRQKNRFMAVIRAIVPQVVELVLSLIHIFLHDFLRRLGGH